jgi:16S rRNA processing protein RimM
MTASHADGTKSRVCLGIVVGARGLKGEVRIKSFTAEPDDVAAYGDLASEDGKRTYKVRVVGLHRGSVIARVAGVADRTAADRLKGEKLYVARAALPPVGDGVYYHADLVGLRVERTDGMAVGRVRAVENFGAGDILDVAAPGGNSVMVPLATGTIAAVDMKAGVVRVIPMPGLLDDAGETGNDEGGKTTEQGHQPKARHRGR